MNKNFLYIIDPLTSLNLNTDTSVAIMEEAQSRNITNYACEISELFIKDGKCHMLCAPVYFDKQNQTIDYTQNKSVRSVDDFNVVFMRKDPPVDETFISALWLLRAYEPKKTFMVNEPNGILVANEKLFGLNIAHAYFSDTLIANNISIIKDFIKKHKKIVLKPINKSSGAGVLIFENTDKNLNSAIELLTLNNNFIVVQKYIENAQNGDKRILLLDGQILGAILRTPHTSDYRANLHAGGSFSKALITPKDMEIINHLKPYLKNLGLHFVGLDIIEGYLTEINVTSPTTIRQIELLENINLKAKIVDYVLKN